MNNLLELRKQYKAGGISVSVNDLVIKAVAVALTRCPEMNCVWHGDQVGSHSFRLSRKHINVFTSVLIDYCHMFCSKQYLGWLHTGVFIPCGKTAQFRNSLSSMRPSHGVAKQRFSHC